LLFSLFFFLILELRGVVGLDQLDRILLSEVKQGVDFSLLLNILGLEAFVDVPSLCDQFRSFLVVALEPFVVYCREDISNNGDNQVEEDNHVSKAG